MIKLKVLCSVSDDETLGCGGVIKKFSDMGKQIFILVVAEEQVVIFFFSNFKSKIIT